MSVSFFMEGYSFDSMFKVATLSHILSILIFLNYSCA